MSNINVDLTLKCSICKTLIFDEKGKRQCDNARVISEVEIEKTVQINYFYTCSKCMEKVFKCMTKMREKNEKIS